MSTKLKSPPGPAPLLKNVGQAPIVYFDSVPVYGTFGGNLEIELSARMLLPKADGSVVVDMGCTGHLRCSANAAVMLVDALTKAIEMLSKQQAEQNEIVKN